MFDLWRGGAVGRDRQGAQGHLQGEFLLRALRRVRKPLEQPEPCGHMPDRFCVSSAQTRPLARAVPIRDGLHHKAGFGVMMCHQLRLGLDGLRKLLLQRLRDLLMQLVASAFE